MPKKKSAKAKTAEKPKAEAASEEKEKEAVEVEQEKNESDKSNKMKKLSNEIDEIFAGKKRKKNCNESADGAEKSKPLKKKKKSIVKDDEGRFTDPPAKTRRKTEDGFTIYGEDELGFNNANAGGTPLCPFDCSCCF